MSGLILSMLRARWAQAVTLFLLAAVAVAAAVAGPVATRATDAAVVRLEVTHAADDERAISIIAATDPTNRQASAQLDALADQVDLPGLDVVRSGEIMTFGPTADPAAVRSATETRVVFRDRICEHVVVLSGRCLTGAREILIGEETAKRRNLTPGDIAAIQAARYTEDGALVPDGELASVTVVGIYRPLEAGDAYWAGQRYFSVDLNGRTKEPVFITRTGMALVDHTLGSSYLDALAPVPVLTADRLQEIGDEVAAVKQSVATLGGISVSSGLPKLAQRIATSRELAHELGPVAFIPLTAISIFVIYLAVGYGVFGRRREIGLVGLRGMSAPRRWLLAGGEAVVPVLASAPVGYVLGHLGVGLVARLRLGSNDGAALSTDSLPYAAVALLVALVVALLGQRRAMREPVVELLRGVPRGGAAWRTIAFEAVVGALAVAGTLQLRASSDGITGLGLLVPGLLVVAVALVAARAFAPATGMVARVALRRGWLGTGLAAAQLARRQGSQRLLALLAVGLAMLSFVAAGMDVASRAREDRATVTMGAPRVLRVNANARALLAATDAVDPGGTWAMAAVTVDPLSAGDPEVLALDTARLGAVAFWRPEFGAEPGAVAAALAPPPASAVELRSDTLELDLQVFTGRAHVRLDLELLGTDGGRVIASTGDLTDGEQTVTAAAPGCADGCRLVGLRVPGADVDTVLNLLAVRQRDPDAEVVSAGVLGDRTRWRGGDNTIVSPSGSGLVIRSGDSGFGSTDVRVGLVDAPLPVPVAAVDEFLRPGLPSLDRKRVQSHVVLPMTMLPRLGTHGVLVDLRYLERTLIETPPRAPAEIWLGPSAPADAADQLRTHGLAVISSTDVAAVREALGIGGPALALQFHLAAAVLGVVLAFGGLGLVMAVDRRSRGGDLWALRVQGLRGRVARRAGLWGYLSTVLLAALAGLLGAVVAWAVAGDRLPVFADAESVLAPPRWPHWSAVLLPWTVAVVALVVAVVLVPKSARPAGERG